MGENGDLFITVGREARVEFEEKRSLFIGHAIRTDTEEEAQAFVKKIKKGVEDNLTIELVKNPDILKEISAIESNVKIVGFCAESENLLENARVKIQKKGCDLLVANDISRKDIGFSSDMNEVYILDKNLKISHIGIDTKINIAKNILEKIFE